MIDNIINPTQAPVKLRPNLWIATDGAVIGYGTLLAPGGLYYCFTCNTANCEHVGPVRGEWESGRESVVDEPLAFDDDELIFASGIECADDYAIEEPRL